MDRYFTLIQQIERAHRIREGQFLRSAVTAYARDFDQQKSASSQDSGIISLNLWNQKH
jgi:hypothetical protein